jgi:hypothetical protein
MQKTKVNVTEAKGPMLNALVAMSLGHQLFVFDDWSHQMGKDKGRLTERVEETIAFSPFRAKWVMFRETGGRREIVSIPDFEKNANLSVPLLEAAKIGVAPLDIVVDDQSWRASSSQPVEIGGVKTHCAQRGDSMIQAGLRTLVELKLGKTVMVPAPLFESFSEPATAKA